MTVVDPRTPFSKTPFDIEKQCERALGRGLICDEGTLRELLSRISYYRFTGYLWWFQVTPTSHQLRSGTQLSDVIALYEFDLKLRILLIECIDLIEVWFRGQFTNHLSVEFGPMGYTNPAYFASASALARDAKKLQERFAPPTEPFIETFFSKHSDPFPPLWMATEVMSLGLLSKWFDNFKVDRVRKSIAAGVMLHPDVLASYLRQLTVIRNACAHHNRLWNRNFGTGIKLAKSGEVMLLDALDGSDESKIFRALAYTAYLVRKIDSASDLHVRLREHLLSGEDDWINDMDVPRDFEADDLWAN
jgi:abortive infection bacteriophage resistance protein